MTLAAFDTKDASESLFSKRPECFVYLSESRWLSLSLSEPIWSILGAQRVVGDYD